MLSNITFLIFAVFDPWLLTHSLNYNINTMNISAITQNTGTWKHSVENPYHSHNQLVRTGSRGHQAGSPWHEAAGSHDHWEDSLAVECNMMGSRVHAVEVRSLDRHQDSHVHDRMDNHVTPRNLALVLQIDIQNHSDYTTLAQITTCDRYMTENTCNINKKHLKNVGPIRYCEPPLHCQ